MKVHCQSNAEATGYFEHAMEEMNFSARARILKVARTRADLGGSESIRPNHILDVIQFRSLDRKLFFLMLISNSKYSNGRSWQEARQLRYVQKGQIKLGYIYTVDFSSRIDDDPEGFLKNGGIFHGRL